MLQEQSNWEYIVYFTHKAMNKPNSLFIALLCHKLRMKQLIMYNSQCDIR